MKKHIIPILLVPCALLIALLQFGFIFMLLALLPSIVALFVDHDRHKSTFKTVIASNFAATLPTLVPMIQSSIRIKHLDTYAIMSDPKVWLLAYSGAAAGWCLIYLCRFIANFMITLSYEYNIHALEGQQQQLVDEWGQQITRPVG